MGSRKAWTALLALLPSHTGDTGVNAGPGPMSTLLAALSDNSNNKTHQNFKLRICIKNQKLLGRTNKIRRARPVCSSRGQSTKTRCSQDAFGSGAALVCSMSRTLLTSVLLNVDETV